jgi:uncharacterized protein (TIGR00297 family)
MRSWLSPAGAVAAALVGVAVLAGTGWRGLMLLAVFLATSSALTPGGGQRRPAQVYANGGVAALCAVLAHWEPAALPAFAGALAAATADTWSTEIGGRSRQRPRLLLTWTAVAPGTSGGVTPLGTLGGAAGAILVGAAALLLHLAQAREAAVVAAAGIAGMVVDSLLGATAQARWRCASCGADTEDPRHACAMPRLHRVSGLPWLTNDSVNVACTAAGAALAALPALLGRG